MAMDVERLNPRSLDDWRLCFDNVRQIRWTQHLNLALACCGTLAIILGFMDILHAIPEEPAQGLLASTFILVLTTGALVISYTGAMLATAPILAAFQMLTTKRTTGEEALLEPPVTAALDEGLHPQEAAGIYEADCSITLVCYGCGKEMCPGCGDNCMISFSLTKAYVWCQDCTGKNGSHAVRNQLQDYYGRMEKE